MSFVRIFCRSSERAAAFVARLESLGHSVETIERDCQAGSTADHRGATSPTQLEPAEIEIELDECSLDEALAHADAFARREPGAKIFVASGVLSNSDIPLTEEQSRPTSLWSRIRERFSRRAEEEYEYGPELQAAHQEAPASLSFSETAHDNVAPAVAHDSSPSSVPAAGLPDPDAALAEKLRAERMEQIQAAALSRQAEERERVARLRQQAEAERQREEQRQAFEAELVRRNREAEAEVLRMALEAERIQVEREQSRQRQSADQDAPELARVSNPEVPAQVNLPESEPAAAIPTHPTATPEVSAAIPVLPTGSVNTGDRKRQAERRGWRRIREWQIAAAAGAAFGILLMGAWSLATSPSPASPLAPSRILPGTLRQEVPFGPVTLTNPTPSAPAPQKVEPAATKTAVPAKHAKPSAIKPAVRKRKVRVENRHSSRQATMPPDEVVVHHYAPAQRGAARSLARGQTKTISDMN